MDWFSKYSPHCLLIVTILFKLAMSGAGQGDGVHQFNQGGQDNSNNEKIGPPASLMRDRAHIQDKDHMRAHLEGVVDIDAIASSMPPDEMEFHFFLSHDTDRDRRLDGLELMQSLLHVNNDQGWVEGGGTPPPSAQEHAPHAQMSEENLIRIVDKILADDDINGDGYVDYAEFSHGADKSDDNRDDDLDHDEEDDVDDDEYYYEDNVIN